jgi:hypothetical protein
MFQQNCTIKYIVMYSITKTVFKINVQYFIHSNIRSDITYKL